MFSHAVSLEYKPVDSGTTPNTERISETGRLFSSSTEPDVGRYTPDMSRSSVVFPAPFPPTSPMTDCL